jgi:hypothetical protein
MRKTSLLLTLALATASCSEPTPDTLDEMVVVPDGKEDDFLSLSGAEFVIEGRYTVTLEEDLADADEAARLARAEELIAYQQVAIAWFLTQYFVHKENDVANHDFGGWGGMAKANTAETLDIRHEEGLTYSFAVAQLIAGPTNLLELMADDLTPVPGGLYQFVLTIGTPSNEDLARLETNNEWYRSAPWSDWNPATVPAGQRTDLTLTIRPEVASTDAWFDYPALFADGLLTIDVHFGWDYHGNYHVTHARSLFDWLRTQGFAAPVETFEQLDRRSGPFTRMLTADGRNIGVEVRVFYGHPGPDSDTDPDTAEGGRNLEADMRESLRTRDVIVYSGHSGPFYGFALANWRRTDEGDLDDSEMSSVEMPADRYQVVFAEGCDTYHIGEAFRRNPAKPDGAFIDIITTTAPSDAGTPRAVQDMIAQLTRADRTGSHDPATIKTLLRDLDTNSYWAHSMYGVHGIDDDPQLHPWADRDMMCEECASDADCGGAGNRCARLQPRAARRCVPLCTSDAACGEGAACRPLAQSSTSTIVEMGCTPADMTCD